MRSSRSVVSPPFIGKTPYQRTGDQPGVEVWLVPAARSGDLDDERRVDLLRNHLTRVGHRLVEDELVVRPRRGELVVPLAILLHQVNVPRVPPVSPLCEAEIVQGRVVLD